jgi:uncharacterized membrane protein
MVQKRRHIIKAISYGIGATFITWACVYIATGDYLTGLAIAPADRLIKFLWFYSHERMWYKSKWGVKR